jgi:YbbR domain-containing protein
MQAKKLLIRSEKTPPILSKKEDRAIFTISVSIAFIFWGLVKLSQPYAITKDIAINYIMPSDKIFAELPPQSLVGTVEGTGWDLISKSFYAHNYQVDIEINNRYSTFINTSELITKVESQIEPFSLKRISPEYLMISLEEKVAKKVPIRLNLEANISTQYYIKEDIIITPDSIIIYGIKSSIDSINHWETEPLIIKNASKNIEIKIKIKPSYNHLIEVEVLDVEVFVPIERLAEKKFFVPVIIKNYSGKDSIKIFPKKIQLQIAIGLSDFDKLDESKFVAEVDMTDAEVGTGNNTLPIYVPNYPTYVRAIHFSPKSVEYFILK